MKNNRVLFIQPHKTVPKSNLKKYESPYLAQNTDEFARPSPSLSAMTVLGSLPKDWKKDFIDATADNPNNIFSYNKNINLIGMGNEQILNEISDSNPDTIMINYTFTTEYFTVNRLINLIKEKYNILIIVGGHHATLKPEWHLDAGADIVALGEGEPIAEEIVNKITKDKIPDEGVAYLDRGELKKKNQKRIQQLDREWELEKVLKDKKGNNTRDPKRYMPETSDPHSNTGVLYFSRGCPYNCPYCHQSMKDKMMREMSLEKRIELTEKAISLDVNTFHNEADTFGITKTDRAYLEWVAEQRKNNRNINLVNTNGLFAKYFFPNYKERAELLKNAGFKTATVSIESFNEKYNNGKLRGIGINDLRDCFDYIRSLGLNIDIYMMKNFPKQIRSELENDKRNINYISKPGDKTTCRSLNLFPEQSIQKNNTKI